MGRPTSSPPTIISNPQEVVRRAKAIKNHFFPRTKPAAYVILDLETTGLDTQEDWPIEVAALFVTCDMGGEYQVVHSYHSHLDWIGSGLANPVAFRSRLDKCNAAMAESSPDVKRPTADTLQALGKNPQVVLTDLGFLMRDFFAKMGQTHHIAICGHNVFFFDANVLHHTYAKTGIQSPLIGNMLDTGLIVKAAQIDDSRLALSPETLVIDWMREVRNIRAKGVKWSLQGFCKANFRLDLLLPDYVCNMPHSSLSDVWDVMTMLKLFDSHGV